MSNTPSDTRASTPTEKGAGELSADAKTLLEGPLFSRGWTHRADHEADDERVRLVGFEISEAAMPVNQTLDALREIKAAAMSRVRSASVTFDPLDWVLVPRKPTAEMLTAKLKSSNHPDGVMESRHDLREWIWGAMVKAAPTPPAHGEGELRAALQIFATAADIPGMLSGEKVCLTSEDGKIIWRMSSDRLREAKRALSHAPARAESVKQTVDPGMVEIAQTIVDEMDGCKQRDGSPCDDHVVRFGHESFAAAKRYLASSPPQPDRNTGEAFRKWWREDCRFGMTETEAVASFTSALTEVRNG